MAGETETAVMPEKEALKPIVDDGIRAYFVSRHDRVQSFVDEHFSLRGTLRIHQAAVGWDIAKAPVNLTLALPQAGLKAAAGAARKMGATRAAHALQTRQILLRTRVAAELEWLVITGLLELPFQQGVRTSTRDVLADTILADPRVAEPLQDGLSAIGRERDSPAFRDRLTEALTEYAGTRAAASEIATGLVTLGAGALTVNKLTPGIATLGPSLAALLAQQAAIASFPLGSGLGGVWYGVFPAAPTGAMVFGLTGGLMLGATVFAAFAGVITDPIQRRLGLHQRRLHRMLDALERQMLDGDAAGFTVRDHYVARLLDVFDWLGVALRLTRS